MSKRRPLLLVSAALLLTAVLAVLVYQTGLLPPSRPAASPSELRNSTDEAAPATLGLAVEAPDQGGPPTARSPQEAEQTPTPGSDPMVIYFYPNDANPLKRVARQHTGEIVEELYDPNAPATLRRVHQLVAGVKDAHVAIVGYADASPGDRTASDAAHALAERRALAVEAALEQQITALPKPPTVTFEIATAGHSRSAGSDTPQQHWRRRCAKLQVTVRQR